MFQICPKCAYARNLQEQRGDACPHCGLVFSKYVLYNAKREKARQAARLASLAQAGDDEVNKRLLYVFLLVLIVAAVTYAYPL